MIRTIHFKRHVTPMERMFIAQWIAMRQVSAPAWFQIRAEGALLDG